MKLTRPQTQVMFLPKLLLLPTIIMPSFPYIFTPLPKKPSPLSHRSSFQTNRRLLQAIPVDDDDAFIRVFDNDDDMLDYISQSSYPPQTKVKTKVKTKTKMPRKRSHSKIPPPSKHQVLSKIEAILKRSDSPPSLSHPSAPSSLPLPLSPHSPSHLPRPQTTLPSTPTTTTLNTLSPHSLISIIPNETVWSAIDVARHYCSDPTMFTTPPGVHLLWPFLEEFNQIYDSPPPFLLFGNEFVKRLKKNTPLLHFRIETASSFAFVSVNPPSLDRSFEFDRTLTSPENKFNGTAAAAASTKPTPIQYEEMYSVMNDDILTAGADGGREVEGSFENAKNQNDFNPGGSIENRYTNIFNPLPTDANPPYIVYAPFTVACSSSVKNLRDFLFQTLEKVTNVKEVDFLNAKNAQLDAISSVVLGGCREGGNPNPNPNPTHWASHLGIPLGTFASASEARRAIAGLERIFNVGNEDEEEEEKEKAKEPYFPVVKKLQKNKNTNFSPVVPKPVSEFPIPRPKFPWVWDCRELSLMAKETQTHTHKKKEGLDPLFAKADKLSSRTGLCNPNPPAFVNPVKIGNKKKGGKVSVSVNKVEDREFDMLPAIGHTKTKASAPVKNLMRSTGYLKKHGEYGTIW